MANEKIISELQKLVNQIKFDIDHAKDKKESMSNYYRLKQIKSLIEIIKKYPTEIKTEADINNLKKIKGVGEGSIRRITEILKTGKLAEITLKEAQEEYLKQVEALTEVYGIGDKTAHDIITKYKITNVNDLKKAYKNGKIELNDQILLGLKYYNIYKKSIPRSEIDEINDYFSKVTKLIDKNIQHVICGSYRRQKPMSNDIDVLLIHKKIITKKQLNVISVNKENTPLFKFVEKLKQDGMIVDDIDKDYEVKYMGFFQFHNKLKYPVRRLDIMFVPFDSYYTALVHFTGSGEFNQKIRELAIDLGYTLNQYGLYKTAEPKTSDQRIITKKLVTKRIPINSEEEVFEKLGLEYIPPEKR